MKIYIKISYEDASESDQFSLTILRFDWRFTRGRMLQRRNIY